MISNFDNGLKNLGAVSVVQRRKVRLDIDTGMRNSRGWNAGSESSADVRGSFEKIEFSKHSNIAW
jgi:hypothetical protein